MSTGGESSVQENKVNPMDQKSFWILYGWPYYAEMLRGINESNVWKTLNLVLAT